ncbi:MAG: hypothetical protein ABIK23_04235 [candidate division WOR-3 bacterium]
MKAKILLALILVIGFAQTDSLPPDSIKAPFRLVQDGPVRISAQIIKKPPVLTIGDRLQLRLSVKHPKDLTVSPPFSSRPEEVTVTSHKHHIELRGDTAVDVYNLTLAIFTVGDVKLAPFLVTYQDKGELCAAASDSIPLQIKSLISDKMQDINDLKPQFGFPNLLPLWIFLGLVLAGLGAFFGLRFWRRYQQEKEAAVPKLPPWEEALLALNALPVEDWVKRGQIKRLYYTVSEIVKRYLTRRFEFPAIDQTTTEIVRELKARKVAELERFSTFFLDADLVKYAKFVPEEPAAVVSSARELINLTTPLPATAETGSK